MKTTSVKFKSYRWLLATSIRIYEMATIYILKQDLTLFIITS